MYNFFWRGVSKSDVIAGGGWVSSPDSDIENGEVQVLSFQWRMCHVCRLNPCFVFLLDIFIRRQSVYLRTKADRGRT